MNLHLSLADLRSAPFPYALFHSVFSDPTHASLLTWLENAKSWKLAKTDFYQQYEFSVEHTPLPPTVQFLADSTFKSTLRTQIEELFNVQLTRQVSVLAHKLEPGQHIGIHNDLRYKGESHRFTVQLNRELVESDGGCFMLFNSADVQDPHRILRPVSNSALAFAISEKSYHAVSTQHVGIRFSLLFSFFPKYAELS